MGSARFNLYVISLSEEVLSIRKFRKENPNYIEGKPCAYVGMTGLTPEKRFEAHLNGHKSCWYVEKFGVDLMPSMFEHINPLSYEDAVEEEKRLAERLRRAGWAVWQR